MALHTLFVLSKEPFSLLELGHELSLRARIIFIDVKKVMDGLSILLIKFGTEPFEHLLQFFDIDSAISTHVAGSEKLHVRDASIFEDGEQLKDGLVLEWHVVV